MRNRNNQIVIRLNDREYKYFQKQVELSGLSMNTYILHLIMGYKIKERPHRDYEKLAWEISKVGTNINQIAHKVNAAGNVFNSNIDTAVLLQKKIIELMRDMR